MGKDPAVIARVMERPDARLLREAVDDAARQLASAEHRDGASYIRTPLCYPGGSAVVVRVSEAHPKFLVSDFGGACNEAELMGVAGAFSRHAPQIAERAGIRFDQHAFFILEVERHQLPGAIVTVANCSQEAVATAALRTAERRHADDSERLYRRLITIFEPRLVARDAEVAGKSSTAWHVASLVNLRDRRTIFDPVSHHHASVFAAATKFQDIARIDDAPVRVAVVRNKSEFGTYLGVLSQVAHVIERDVANDRYARLAKAA